MDVNSQIIYFIGFEYELQHKLNAKYVHYTD